MNINEAPNNDREDGFEGAEDLQLTEAQIAEFRKKYMVEGAPLEHEADIYEHFTPEELVVFLDAIHDTSDHVDPEHLRLLSKYMFLMEQLSKDRSQADSGALERGSDEEKSQIESDWERLQAALNREGLLRPKGEE
jgi:hypothetical protein